MEFMDQVPYLISISSWDVVLSVLAALEPPLPPLQFPLLHLLAKAGAPAAVLESAVRLAPASVAEYQGGLLPLHLSLLLAAPLTSSAYLLSLCRAPLPATHSQLTPLCCALLSGNPPLPLIYLLLELDPAAAAQPCRDPLTGCSLLPLHLSLLSTAGGCAYRAQLAHALLGAHPQAAAQQVPSISPPSSRQLPYPLHLAAATCPAILATLAAAHPRAASLACGPFSAPAQAVQGAEAAAAAATTTSATAAKPALRTTCSGGLPLVIAIRARVFDSDGYAALLFHSGCAGLTFELGALALRTQGKAVAVGRVQQELQQSRCCRYLMHALCGGMQGLRGAYEREQLEEGGSWEGAGQQQVLELEQQQQQEVLEQQALVTQPSLLEQQQSSSN